MSYAASGQLGLSIVQGSIIYFIGSRTGPDSKQTALTSLRIGNNIGQFLSYLAARSLVFLGSLGFFAINAASALLALTFLLSSRQKLGNTSKKSLHQNLVNTNSSKSTLKIYILYTLFICIFAFSYDFIISGTISILKIPQGNEGLKVFSNALALNSLACALLYLPIMKYFKAVPMSLILNYNCAKLTVFY